MFTNEEKQIIKNALNEECEAVTNHMDSMSKEAAYEYRSDILTIIEKLDGGCGTIWVNTAEKIKELLELHNESVLIIVEHLYKSGAIDPSNYNHAEWSFAKILLTAALRQQCDEYAPMTMNGNSIHERDLENLKNF